MSALTQTIMEHLRRMDEHQQQQVLDFIQHLEQTTWTAEELVWARDMIANPQPKTGAEIVAMLQSMDSTGWEAIEDGTAWVAEQRRHQRDRHQW